MEVLKRVIVLLFLILFFKDLSYAQGSEYCDSYRQSAPIFWDGKTNKSINQVEISNQNGYCIELRNCNNITIQNCKLGPSSKDAIHLYNCKNVTIVNCAIDSVATGIYARQSQGINFIYNDVKNVLGPFPKGQMAQFDKVSGAGNQISYNAVENILGESSPEDVISIYMSNGTIDDSIKIVGNWIRGGGPSLSGGGIMVGDNGGSYILVKDNILVNSGQYGIGISSGTNITIQNNKIFSKQQSFTNVGLYVWNQYSSSCGDNMVADNEINWTDKYGNSSGCWDNGNCGPIIGWSTNNCAASIDSTILPEKIIRNCVENIDVNQKTSGGFFSVYPRPANESITVASSSIREGSVILIYDLSGKKIVEQATAEKINYIDVSALSGGFYFVKVISANVVQVRKFIKK